MSSMLRFVQALWRLAFVVVAINAGITCIWDIIFSILGYEPLVVMEVISAARFAAHCFFSAPLAIAIHRYIVLGELPLEAYPLDPSLLRFRRYFDFLLIPTVLRHLGQIVCLFGESASGAGLATSHVAQGVAFIVLWRLVLLFPAIAIDARSAHWRIANRALHGHGWSTFFELFITLLPIFFLTNVLDAIILRPLSHSQFAFSADPIVTGLCQTLWVLVFAAVSSRFYLRIARARELPDAGASTATLTPIGRRMQSATGMVVIAGLFAIIRGSYFLPIEARLPPSAAYFISGFYDTGLIVEQSDLEAVRWYEISTHRTGG
jgi:hypothetical protein